MGIKLSEFPFQPKKMECCKECVRYKKKDCEPNHMNCIDFCIANNEFIAKKQKEIRSKS